MASNSSRNSGVATSTTSLVCVTGEKNEMPQETTISWIIHDMEDKMKTYPPGKVLKTDIFRIKNSKWLCKVWPNGWGADCKSNISFAVESLNKEALEVKSEWNVGKNANGWFKSYNFMYKFPSSGTGRGFSNALSHTFVQENKKQLIKGSRMELMIKISLVEDTPSPQDNLKEEASEINRLRNLSENFSNLLVDENSSDFLIICGDDKFPVHRNVLKARSSFFNGLLRNENNYAENNTGQLVINNMDSGTVKIVIEYIYTGKIKDLESKAVQLLKAADMYDFPLLKKCCEDELISSMNLENVVDLFVLAADHNASDLKVVAKKMILKNKADIVKQEGYQAKMGTLVFELFEAM